MLSCLITDCGEGEACCNTARHCTLSKSGVGLQFLFDSAEADFRGSEGDVNAVDRLTVTSGKMVLLDKLLRRLKETGHRCCLQLLSAVWECCDTFHACLLFLSGLTIVALL